MSYDTSGRGWGRGDVVYACKVGKGNCTDFHSLFMALALAEGIPALNYLVRPYAEADGKPYHNIEFERRYKDIKGGERT